MVEANPWSCAAQYASVAQLAEQLICNQQVNGSSPFGSFVPTEMSVAGHPSKTCAQGLLLTATTCRMKES